MNDSNPLNVNAGLAARMLFKLSRETLLWDTGSNQCATNGVVTPILVKSNYRLQVARPVRGNDCIPIGRPSLLWGPAKNPPYGTASTSPDNFLWSLTRRRVCCVGYSLNYRGPHGHSCCGTCGRYDRPSLRRRTSGTESVSRISSHVGPSEPDGGEHDAATQQGRGGDEGSGREGGRRLPLPGVSGKLRKETQWIRSQPLRRRLCSGLSGHARLRRQREGNLTVMSESTSSSLSSLPLQTVRNYVASVARLGESRHYPGHARVHRGDDEDSGRRSASSVGCYNVTPPAIRWSASARCCGCSGAVVDPLLFRRYGIDRVSRRRPRPGRQGGRQRLKRRGCLEHDHRLVPPVYGDASL